MTHGLSIGDYRYASLWDGCIGAWCPSATGPGGDILADRSASQRHGILTSMDPETDWNVQDDGVALDFEGTNDRVELPSYLDYSDSPAMGISCWVYSRATAFQSFVSCRSTSTTTPILFQLDSGSAGTELRFLVRNDAGTLSNASLAGGMLTNEWFHIAGTRSSVDTELFRNGIRIASSTAVTGAITAGATLIGAAYSAGTSTPGNYLNGLIDDVRIYNRTLTASDIQLLATRRGIAYERRIRRRVWVPASGSYQLACDAGSYSISGTDCALTIARTLACDAGSYTISGTDAGIERHYVFDPNAELPPHINIYTINGGEAFLNVGHVFSLDSGSYAIAGTDCALTVSRTLACDVGAYVITGSDVALETGGDFELPCDAGSYAIAGTDCALTIARTLACDAGSYAVSGTDCALTVARTLACDVGAYVISGTDVALETPGQYAIACEAGSYAISGTDCALTATRTIACDPGAYVLTGTDAGLTIARTIGCDPGAYLVAGTDCSLEATQQLTLVCDSGAYVINGTSCTLQYSGAGSLRHALGWISRKTRRVWIAKRHSQF